MGRGARWAYRHERARWADVVDDVRQRRFQTDREDRDDAGQDPAQRGGSAGTDEFGARDEYGAREDCDRVGEQHRRRRMRTRVHRAVRITEGERGVREHLAGREDGNEPPTSGGERGNRDHRGSQDRGDTAEQKERRPLRCAASGQSVRADRERDDGCSDSEATHLACELLTWADPHAQRLLQAVVPTGDRSPWTVVSI